MVFNQLVGNLENEYDKGNRFYFYKYNDNLALLQSNKEKKYRRLSFRDICRLHLQNGDLDHVRAQSLKRMCVHKLQNDDKRNLFCRIFLLVLDYVRNWYENLGFRSTTSIGFELLDSYYKHSKTPTKKTKNAASTKAENSQGTSTSPAKPQAISPTSSASPSPTSTSSAKPSTPPAQPQISTTSRASSVKPEATPPSRSASHNSSCAKSTNQNTHPQTSPTTPPRYKVPNPSIIISCSTPGSPVFLERRKMYEINAASGLGVKKNQPDIVVSEVKVDSKSAIEDYLKSPAKSKYKVSVFNDLTVDRAEDLWKKLSKIEDQSQFVLDFLILGKKDQANQFIDKIEIDMQLLKLLLQKSPAAFNDYEGLNLVNALMIFFKRYDRLYLNTTDQNEATLPANDPAVINVFKLLLKTTYNNNEVEKYLQKLVNKEEFNIDAFFELISVIKENHSGHAKDIANGAKTILIDCFKLKLTDQYRSHKDKVLWDDYLKSVGAIT